MATCPYCEGEVGESAQKCRHCGEWLPSAARDEQEAAQAAVGAEAGAQKRALDDAIAKATIGGAVVVSREDDRAVIEWPATPVNHVLHLILSIVTLGFWLVVWLLMVLSARPARRVMIHIGENGEAIYGPQAGQVMLTPPGGVGVATRVAPVSAAGSSTVLYQSAALQVCGACKRSTGAAARECPDCGAGLPWPG